jgi:hypothetical protein
MRIERTGHFTLAAEIEAVMPLFTAEGERAWAPGWEPSYPDSPAHGVGQVWTTGGAGETTWVTVQADDTCVRYARVTPGDSAGIVTVSCAPTTDGTTVTVTYDLTALSPAGESRLVEFSSAYDDMLRHWQHHTTVALHSTA